MYLDFKGIQFTAEESAILCSIISKKVQEEKEKADRCGRMAAKCEEMGHCNLAVRLVYSGSEHIGNACGLEQLEREIIASTLPN